MDRDLQRPPVTVGSHAVGFPGSLKRFPDTVLITVAGAAVALAVAYIAARMRLPTSRGLLMEGQWYFRSWAQFPWLEGLGMLAGLVLLPVGWERRLGVTWRNFGFQAPRRWALCLLAAMIGAVFFAMISQARISMWRLNFDRPAFIFFSTYFLCVAVAEEALFRGFLQRRLRLVSNSWLAVTCASLAFACWHGLPDSASILFLRIFGGAMMGVLYDRSGSLWPSISLHWLINMGQV